MKVNRQNEGITPHECFVVHASLIYIRYISALSTHHRYFIAVYHFFVLI